jgi:hypothetical protein
MTIRADFTEDEWTALEQGVIGAGMFVAVSDFGFSDEISEINVLMMYVAGFREASESELVRELANVQVNPLAVNAPAWRIEEDTLAALHSAAATLAAKAPHEVAAYRDLVLGTAQQVALDRSGVRPRETAAIGKIREALGLEEV